MMRRQIRLLGNLLMVLGVFAIVVGAATAIYSFSPDHPLSESMSLLSVLSLFMGLIIWFTGAMFSGKNSIAERYWWCRHFDKRCCGKKEY